MNTNTQIAFKDTSIFQDVIEFVTASNIDVRAMDQGCGVYSIFTKDEDDDAYIHQAKVRIKGRATPRKLWDAYIDCEIDQEDDDTI